MLFVNSFSEYVISAFTFLALLAILCVGCQLIDAITEFFRRK